MSPISVAMVALVMGDSFLGGVRRAATALATVTVVMATGLVGQLDAAGGGDDRVGGLHART